MRILLIDPPMQRFTGFAKYGLPLGLLSLAEAWPCDVSVWDADYNPHGESMPFTAKINRYHLYPEALETEHPIWDEIAEVITREKPDAVGVSVISPKLPSALRVAKIAKACGVPRVIAGGPHVTIDMPSVLRSPDVDGCVAGEGESAFPEIVARPNVEGIRMYEIHRPRRSALLNLDAYRPNDLGMVMSSRGCPAKCAFCCSRRLWGRRVVNRDVQDVVDEIRVTARDYGTDRFYLVDDTFTCNRHRVDEFCRSVASLGVKWSCLTRADCLTGDMIALMRESGCEQVKIGVESGSPRMLQRIKKGVSPDHVRTAAKLLSDAGMPWVAYAMCGLPGEMPEDVRATMDLLDECDPDFVSLAVFTPYPGTDLYSELGLYDIPHHLLSHHSDRTLGGPIGPYVREAFEWADSRNRWREA